MDLAKIKFGRFEGPGAADFVPNYPIVKSPREQNWIKTSNGLNKTRKISQRKDTNREKNFNQFRHSSWESCVVPWGVSEIYHKPPWVAVHQSWVRDGIFSGSRSPKIVNFTIFQPSEFSENPRYSGFFRDVRDSGSHEKCRFSGYNENQNLKSWAWKPKNKKVQRKSRFPGLWNFQNSVIYRIPIPEIRDFWGFGILEISHLGLMEFFYSVKNKK